MKKVNFPSNIQDLIQCKENNKIIALSILYVPYNTEEIRHACKSKCNKECEKQVILLIITGKKKWHYLAIKNCLHFLEG